MSPHDEFAERAVLGMVLRLGSIPSDLAALVTPDDWWTPYLRTVAQTCWDLHAQHKTTDPVTVRTEMLRRGERGEYTNAIHLVELCDSAAVPATAAYHARGLRDLAVRRDLILQATRAVQQAENPALDPYDTAAELGTRVTVLAERSDPARSLHVADVQAFLDGDDGYDWLVPGLFEQGDRLLLTASEGAGKSMAIRQLAVTIAAGLHPFGGQSFTPKRVLLVDLENGSRALRRHLRRLTDKCERDGQPVPRGNLRIESRPSGIDLTRLEDERWLLDLCESTQPQMLVIGPLYRMHAADMAKEEPARQLTRVLDTIRARYGCVLVVETHAPHAGQGAVRSLRPVGSSLFMRWPEFGYGITPAQEEATFDLKSWRGPRDERSWPAQLRWGRADEWPWMPVRTMQEWQAQRGETA